MGRVPGWPEPMPPSISLPPSLFSFFAEVTTTRSRMEFHATEGLAKGCRTRRGPPDGETGHLLEEMAGVLREEVKGAREGTARTKWGRSPPRTRQPLLGSCRLDQRGPGRALRLLITACLSLPVHVRGGVAPERWPIVG